MLRQLIGLAHACCALLLLNSSTCFALQPGDSLPHLSGRAANLLDLSAYKGKVIYIDFWASWCEPCRESLPWLNTLRSRFPSRELVILTINEDSEKSDFEQAMRDLKIMLPTVQDSDQILPQFFDLSTLPGSFLVDRSGKISAVFEGFSESQEAVIEKDIGQLLMTPGNASI